MKSGQSEVLPQKKGLAKGQGVDALSHDIFCRGEVGFANLFHSWSYMQTLEKAMIKDSCTS